MVVGESVAGRYILDGHIGEGAFGEVWAARDLQLGQRRVAIKFLKRRELEKIQEKYRAEMLGRFEREAAALAAATHPNLVMVFERGELPDGTQFIVMEYVEGETLRDWLDKFVHLGEQPKIELVRDLFDQICQGVAALHSVRMPGPIVHRDLKSRNVMLIRQSQKQWLPKVLDLGIARVGDRRETNTGLLLGTLAYMAPEQGTGDTRSVGPATDVFSLGVLLIEMVTTRNPPEGADCWWATAMRDERAVRDRICHELPQPLWDVATHALRARPQDRFPNAAVLCEALRAAMPPRETVSPQPSISVRPPTKPSQIQWLPVVLGAAVLSIAGGAGLYALFGNHHDATPASTATPSVPSVPSVPTVESHVSVPSVPVPQEPCANNSVTFTGASFQMGDPTTGTPNQVGAADEGPVHLVQLSDYRLDRTDVTVGCFRRYWAAGHPSPPGGQVAYPNGSLIPWEGVVTEPLSVSTESCNWSTQPGARDRHPINCVNWATAQAYCVWAGGRLPTEAEWEYAARGETGSEFPWGNDPPGDQLCWLGGRAPIDGTCDVESHSSGLSRRGVFDLAGNVWQWTVDRYAVRYEVFPTRDPIGTAQTRMSRTRQPIANHTRVIRGGSWMYSLPNAVRSTLRMMGDPDVLLPTMGFRCAYGSPSNRIASRGAP